MWKWINPKVQSLESQIEDLKDIVNALQSENNFKTEEIVRLREDNKDLLNKIFEVTGIQKADVNFQMPNTAPRAINTSRSSSWALQKQKLESEASLKYWEGKRAAAEIEKLEKEVGVTNAKE